MVADHGQNREFALELFGLRLLTVRRLTYEVDGEKTTATRKDQNPPSRRQVVPCPGCNTRLVCASSHSGKGGKCSRCGTRFPIPHFGRCNAMQ